MEYKLVKSKRKSISIIVQRDGNVLVRAPMRATKAYIDSVVDKNSQWINAQKAVHKKNARRGRPLTDEEIIQLKVQALQIMSEKTHYYEQLMGVKCTGIKITSAKGRWGSCSYNNSICYSYRTQLLTERQQDYIVVHELAHIKQKNHSPLFYKEIEKILPDYREIIKSISQFSNYDLYNNVVKLQ